MLLPAAPAVNEMGWAFNTLVSLTLRWWRWENVATQSYCSFCSLRANWSTTVESKGNKREMDPERTRRRRTKQAKEMVMSRRLLTQAGLPDYFRTEDNYASINCHFPAQKLMFHKLQIIEWKFFFATC